MSRGVNTIEEPPFMHAGRFCKLDGMLDNASSWVGILDSIDSQDILPNVKEEEEIERREKLTGMDIKTPTLEERYNELTGDVRYKIKRSKPRKVVNKHVESNNSQMTINFRETDKEKFRRSLRNKNWSTQTKLYIYKNKFNVYKNGWHNTGDTFKFLFAMKIALKIIEMDIVSNVISDFNKLHLLDKSGQVLIETMKLFRVYGWNHDQWVDEYLKSNGWPELSLEEQRKKPWGMTDYPEGEEARETIQIP